MPPRLNSTVTSPLPAGPVASSFQAPDQLTPPKKLPGVPENHTTGTAVCDDLAADPNSNWPPDVSAWRCRVKRPPCSSPASSPVTQFTAPTGITRRHTPMSPMVTFAVVPVVSNTDQTSIAPDPAVQA